MPTDEEKPKGPLPVPKDGIRISPTVATLMDNQASQNQDRHVWLKIDNVDEGETYFRRLNRVYIDKGRLVLEGDFE